MALDRVLFTTHNGYSKPISPVEETGQAGFEQQRVGHPPVKNVPVGVIELVPVGASTQLLPEEDVPDTDLAQPGLEVLTVEPRVEPRKGRTTYIGYHLHPVPPEKLHENVNRMGRVTDRHQPGTTWRGEISRAHAAPSDVSPLVYAYTGVKHMCRDCIRHLSPRAVATRLHVTLWFMAKPENNRRTSRRLPGGVIATASGWREQGMRPIQMWVADVGPRRSYPKRTDSQLRLRPAITQPTTNRSSTCSASTTHEERRDPDRSSLMV